MNKLLVIVLTLIFVLTTAGCGLQEDMVEEKKYTEKEQKLQDAEQELETREQELEKMEAEKSEQLAELQEKIERLEEEELEGKEEKLQDLRAEKEKLEEEKLVEKKQEIEDLRAEKEKLDEKKKEIEELRAEKEKLEEEEVQKKEDRIETLEEENEKLEEDLKEIKEAKARREDKNVILSLDTEILFDFGSDNLKPEARESLDELASVIEEHSERSILVEGHTDTVPVLPDSRFSSNWDLSAARAVSVVEYLVEENELNPEKFFAGGYGEHQPLKDNDSDENRALNRRVEITFLPAQLEKEVVEPGD